MVSYGITYPWCKIYFHHKLYFDSIEMSFTTFSCLPVVLTLCVWYAFSKDTDTVPMDTPGPKYYPDDGLESNDKTYLKQGMDPFKIVHTPLPTPNATAPNPTFKWTIAADDDCMPSIACPVFSLAFPDFDGKCVDQWMEVTDGVAGSKRYCGKTGPMNMVAAQQDGLREIYIIFKNNYRMFPAKFECTVACGEKNKANFLPKVLTPKIKPDCMCGQKPPRNRIIGGHETYFAEFPWIAAMVVKDTRQPYCIGSVINDRMILTAGHCFKGKFRQAKNTHVVLNAYLMDPMPNINVIKTSVVYRTYDEETLQKLDAANGSFRYSVDRIWIHPLYVSDTSDYDTAVMILSKPINITAFKEYSPICLPDLMYDVDAYSGWTAAISGWGLPSLTALGTNTEMKQITVEVSKPAECKKVFGERLVSTKRQLCAAYFDASEDSCAGDSGGPLIVEYRPQSWYQVGIISWGDGCALKGHPGVYYRTTSTNQWIRYMSNMKEAVWCDVPSE